MLTTNPRAKVQLMKRFSFVFRLNSCRCSKCDAIFMQNHLKSELRKFRKALPLNFPQSTELNAGKLSIAIVLIMGAGMHSRAFHDERNTPMRLFQNAVSLIALKKLK